MLLKSFGISDKSVWTDDKMLRIDARFHMHVPFLKVDIHAFFFDGCAFFITNPIKFSPFIKVNEWAAETVDLIKRKMPEINVCDNLFKIGKCKTLPDQFTCKSGMITIDGLIVAIDDRGCQYYFVGLIFHENVIDRH